MSFNQSSEGGSGSGSLIGKWILFIVISGIGAWLIYLVLGGMFHALGMGKWPTVLKLVKWVSWLFGLYFLAQLWGVGKKRPTVEKASVTSRTGTRLKAGVYNLATLETDIRTIKIANPYRHTLVAGGPGSGKSYSILEPLLVQAMHQGKAGLIYDYKFPTFARLVASTAQRVTPYYVNFDDLSRSHRVNPIHPQIMSRSSFADQFARTVVYNLIPDAATSANPFFADSAQGYLAAIFWFLREEHPQFCTLPHAMALAMSDPVQVVALLETNEETCASIAPIRSTLTAEAQRAAIVGTLQNGLRKINIKEIVWVLSGTDCTLDLNNPQDPKALVLGNNPDLDDTYGPVLALLATVALKQMNQPGKADSIALLDEFPTIYIPNFDTYPATARSNKVAIMVGIQDFSQLEARYGKHKKNAILGTLSNQFYGLQNNLESARYVSDLWGREDVQITSINQSESTGPRRGGSAGHSQGTTERQRIRVQDVANLRQGEFYGKLVESDYSTFKARLKGNSWSINEWDAFTEVTPELIMTNYRTIQQEARSLLAVKPIPPFQPIHPTHAPKPTPAVPKPVADQSGSIPIEPKSKNNGQNQADDF